MIEVKNMSFKYPGQKDWVFSNFDLSLQEGGIYGLLGKNGTGKSTLLYLLSGLLRAAKGSVSVDGMDPKNRDVELLRDLYIVPEEYDLPSLSLRRYVDLYAPFYPNFNKEILSSCLHDFELENDLNLGALSMGQKKKVLMSFALATGVRYLLMDEPTNGLDIPSKSQFRKAVAQNMGMNQTLIISTHQVHDVESLLDHIIMLSNQELLLNVSVEEITQKYVFEYRQPGQMEGVIYAEPTLQGNAVVALRGEDDGETQMNLELLFNAVTKGLVK